MTPHLVVHRCIVDVWSEHAVNAVYEGTLHSGLACELRSDWFLFTCEGTLLDAYAF